MHILVFIPTDMGVLHYSRGFLKPPAKFLYISGNNMLPEAFALVEETESLYENDLTAIDISKKKEIRLQN